MRLVLRFLFFACTVICIVCYFDGLCRGLIVIEILLSSFLVLAFVLIGLDILSGEVAVKFTFGSDANVYFFEVWLPKLKFTFGLFGAFGSGSLYLNFIVFSKSLW